MYPINAILIGSNQSILPLVKRELVNLSVRLEGEFSSVEEATDALRRSSAEKRVLILQMGSSSPLAWLERLATVLPGWPVIALLEGYDPNSSLGTVIISILRAGASEVVSLPIQSAEFAASLDRIATQFVYSVRQTKVIAVAGVNGGSGATTVALNLAYEIARRHSLRCVLVDLSLRMGVVASHLNLEPTHSIVGLLQDTRRIDTNLVQQALIKVAENFEILPGPHKIVATVSTSAKDVGLVVDTLKLVADVVVLDVPCTYDALYFETLTSANQVILIGEQNLPSIRAMKMVREAIGRVSGTEHLVLNKFDPKTKGFEVKRLLKPLEISTLLTVARDNLGMSESMAMASTLGTAAPRSPALADIVTLADTALALEDSTKNKPVGLLGRLGRALVNS